MVVVSVCGGESRGTGLRRVRVSVKKTDVVYYTTDEGYCFVYEMLFFLAAGVNWGFNRFETLKNVNKGNIL